MSAGVEQSTLPLGEAIGFAMQGVRLRLGRMALVVAGIATAIAFMVTLVVLDRLYGQVPPALRGADAGTMSGAFRWMWLGVALLISTAGTFNAILMSVTERVKEIGTLKCLGARDRHVIVIFLFESIFLGAVAGLVGGIAGVGISALMFSAQAGTRYLTVPAIVIDDGSSAFAATQGVWYHPKIGRAYVCSQCGYASLSEARTAPTQCVRCGQRDTMQLAPGLTDSKGRALVQPPAHPDTSTSAMLQEMADAAFTISHAESEPAMAVWRTTATVAGPYDVEVFVPKVDGVDATVAYCLVYADGEQTVRQTVTIDQADTSGRGQWTTLGRANLVAGGVLAVEVTVPAGSTAVADRIRFDNAFMSPAVRILPWALYGMAASMVLSLLAAIVPVWYAARVEPAMAMRYDV